MHGANAWRNAELSLNGKGPWTKGASLSSFGLAAEHAWGPARESESESESVRASGLWNGKQGDSLDRVCGLVRELGQELSVLGSTGDNPREHAQPKQ